MEVSIFMGDPQKCLVYNGKSHLEMDDDWGHPLVNCYITIENQPFLMGRSTNSMGHGQ